MRSCSLSNHSQIRLFCMYECTIQGNYSRTDLSTPCYADEAQYRVHTIKLNRLRYAHLRILRTEDFKGAVFCSSLHSWPCG